MKKLLFISPTTSMDNGAETSIFHLMKLLVQAGHQVAVACHEVGPAEVAKHKALHQAAGIESFYLSSLKWWWEEAPGENYGFPEERAAYYRQNIADLVTYIEDQAVDVVVSNTVNVFQGAVAAKLTGRPHFWMIHEFPDKEFAYYLDKLPFISDYSTQIFSVDGHLKKALMPLFPEHDLKAFIPYTEISAQAIPQGQGRRLVCVGRVTPRKNQLALIEAYHTLARADLELVFIGPADKAYQAQCQAYIDAHELKGVHFLGQQDNPWALVTDQDLCVFPSSMETFGLVYIEAVLHGLPVILSDNDGHLTAYERMGVGQLYPLGDQAALVRQIQAVLADFPAAQAKAQAAREQAKQVYQPQALYAEFLAALDDLPAVAPTSLQAIQPLLTRNAKRTFLERLGRSVSHTLYRIRRKLVRLK